MQDTYKKSPADIALGKLRDKVANTSTLDEKIKASFLEDIGTEVPNKLSCLKSLLEGDG